MLDARSGAPDSFISCPESRLSQTLHTAVERDGFHPLFQPLVLVQKAFNEVLLSADLFYIWRTNNRTRCSRQLGCGHNIFRAEIYAGLLVFIGNIRFFGCNENTS